MSPPLTATLNLNLGDALSADELGELTSFATDRKVSLERVLFDAARAEAARLKGKRAQKASTPEAVAA